MGYQELIVWQYAVDLAVDILRFSSNLPKEERYGLCSQMKRAAVSIPSNIAEGYRRKYGSDDFLQFMRVALGSASELETQIIIVKRAGFVKDASTEKAEMLLGHIQRLLGCIIFRRS